MLKAVFVSDIHAGSLTALRKNPANEIQRALYRKWQEAASGEFARPDALIVAGDAVDGQGPKQGGVYQWTTDMHAQIDDAAALIEMWHAKRVYIIGGSGYHVQLAHTGFSAEEQLGRDIGAEEYPSQDASIPVKSRAHSGPHWFLTFEKATVHVQHHISVSKVFAYMSTPIAREMMKAKLNDPMRHAMRQVKMTAALLQELETFKTRWVIRGHAHYFWLCDSGGMIGCNLPAWKTPDPWLLERDALANGHIGFLGMRINGEKIEYTKSICGAEDVSQIPHSRI